MVSFLIVVLLYTNRVLRSFYKVSWVPTYPICLIGLALGLILLKIACFQNLFLTKPDFLTFYRIFLKQHFTIELISDQKFCSGMSDKCSIAFVIIKTLALCFVFYSCLLNFYVQFTPKQLWFAKKNVVSINLAVFIHPFHCGKELSTIKTHNVKVTTYSVELFIMLSSKLTRLYDSICFNLSVLKLYLKFLECCQFIECWE